MAGNLVVLSPFPLTTWVSPCQPFPLSPILFPVCSLEELPQLHPQPYLLPPPELCRGFRMGAQLHSGSGVKEIKVKVPHKHSGFVQGEPLRQSNRVRGVALPFTAPLSSGGKSDMRLFSGAAPGTCCCGHRCAFLAREPMARPWTCCGTQPAAGRPAP